MLVFYFRPILITLREFFGLVDGMYNESEESATFDEGTICAQFGYVAGILFPSSNSSKSLPIVLLS
jgi:hypothetical protein